MNITKGDLIQLGLNGDFDVIVHGANCFCTMGSGIAAQIKKKCFKAFLADQDTLSGDRSKLGNYSSAPIITEGGHLLTIVNGYTQYNYGREEGVVYVDYDAVRSVFKRIKQDFAGLRIGYCKIGAGLGGGDWEKISAIINEELDGENHTLVEYAQ